MHHGMHADSGQWITKVEVCLQFQGFMRIASRASKFWDLDMFVFGICFHSCAALS